MVIFILTGNYSKFKGPGKKKVLYNSKSQAQLANLNYMFRLQLCKCSISKATPSSSQNIWGLILQCAKHLMQVSSQPTKFSLRQMFCTSQDPLPSVRIGFLNNYSFWGDLGIRPEKTSDNVLIFHSYLIMNHYFISI